MKTCALIPEDEPMLETTIEAGAALDPLAKGNEKSPEKRKGRSIYKHYHRKRRRIQSESFNSHVILNHKAQVDDVMFSDCLVNNFGTNATTDLVDKSAHGCHKSIQSDESYCFLLTDNLMTFFDTDTEPNDDSHMHNADSDDSSVVTEVEYAGLLSFSNKDYINCVLNTEDTIDNIPDSQLLDSDEDVLEDPSFDGDLQDDCHSEDDSFDGDQQDVCYSEDDLFVGDNQDVCHCKDDVESTSFSHLDPVRHNEGETICILNTEDPEIPCNDSIFWVIHPSPSARPQTDTESVDPESQINGPNLSHDSENPHVDCTPKSVSLDHSLSISDHNDSDSDNDLLCSPDIEYAVATPSVRPETATDSVDPTSCFTQSQIYGPGLSSEFQSAIPHAGCTLKSVSMDHNPSVSDHNTDNEDPETPFPSVRPQTDTDSVDPTSTSTQSQIDGPDSSSEFESANPHVDCTIESESMDHNLSSLSDQSSDSDLHCFLDIEDSELRSASIRLQTALDSIDLTSCFTEDDPDLSFEYDYANPNAGCTSNSVSVDHNPSTSDHNSHSLVDTEIPSPSVRPQTATDSIQPASCFTQSQMDGPDLSCEFDSAHPHVGQYVSVDHDPFIADHNNSDSDSDLPCFPDIEALILKLDFEYAQESWISNEVKRSTYKHYKPSVNRLEQRAMSSLGAFAVFYSHHFNYYIKKTEITIGRSTDDNDVDIDLSKESHAHMISRQQATIKMENDGTFTLKNIGKGLILINGKSIARGQMATLGSSCLLQIRGMEFMFQMNGRYVRWYLDNIVKKTQGKFTSFEWSVN